MTGRAAIRAYWREIPDTQDDIRFGSEVLHADGDRAFVHWWASYVRTRDELRFRLDGAFDLEFDPDTGLCRSLREWWHADRPTEGAALPSASSSTVARIGGSNETCRGSTYSTVMSWIPGLR
jgi:SnoaL-like domain